MISALKNKELHSYFFSFTAFSLSFPLKMPIYALIICGVYVLLTASKKDFSCLLGLNKEYILLLYFFILLVSALLSEDKAQLVKQLEIRASFLLIPIIFVLSKNRFTDQIAVSRVFTAFALGVVFASLLCIVLACYKSVSWVSGVIVFDPSVQENTDFVESTVYGGNYFFSVDLSVFMHPTYFSIYCVFSVCIIVSVVQKGLVNRWLGMATIAWLSIFIFFLSSRAVLLTIPILLLFELGIFTYQRRMKFKFALIGVLCTVTLIALFFTNPRLNLLLNAEELIDRNPRIQVWKNGWQVVQESPIFGQGLLDVQRELDEHYLKNQFLEGAEKHYNMHNQYLESMAQSGIFGLIVLILIFLILIKYSREEFLTLFFALIVSINMLAESLLNVFSGVVFFCFITCLLFNQNQRNITLTSIV